MELMFRMRTCASCGKANNPIRKYCTRCGKSLIILKEEKPTPVPASVITETPIPDVTAPADQYVRSDTVKATTNDEWVRPSQVSRDRVRSGSSSSGKSEMEKAKEAFARADGVGIEEAEGSGIVETRMLRASEVRELMGDGATISQETAPPAQPSVTTTPTAPTAQPTPAPTPPASSPPAAAPQVAPSTPPAAAPTPQPAPAAPATNKPAPAATPTPRVETPPPAAPLSIPVKPPTPAPVATAPSAISLDTRIPEVEELLSQVTESEDLQDSKIRACRITNSKRRPCECFHPS